MQLVLTWPNQEPATPEGHDISIRHAEIHNTAT